MAENQNAIPVVDTQDAAMTQIKERVDSIVNLHKTSLTDDLITIDDIIRNRHQLQPYSLDKKYEGEKFWNHAGEIYLNTFTSPQELQLNTEFLIWRAKNLNVDTVLEVGCGFGRIAPFMLEAGVCKTWEGVDFASSMVEAAKKYLSVEHLKMVPEKETDIEKKYREDAIKKFEDIYAHIKIKQGNVLELPYESNSFDIVYSHICLTHIPPKDVQKARSEMVRVSKKYILLAERYAFDFEHPEPHRWSYNHAKAFNNMGLEILECRDINISDRTVGVLLRKRT